MPCCAALLLCLLPLPQDATQLKEDAATLRLAKAEKENATVYLQVPGARWWWLWVGGCVGMRPAEGWWVGGGGRAGGGGVDACG